MSTASLDDSAGRGPVGSATEAVLSWLAVAHRGPVRAEAPSDELDPAGDVLAVWPIGLVHEQEMRGHRWRDPLRVRVRYVVTGAITGIDAALVEATRTGEPSVELTGLPFDAWLAFGCRPRLALLVDMPAVVARPEPDLPVVTESLRLHLYPDATREHRTEPNPTGQE